MNMMAVIAPKSDQINADDLIGGSMTITIRDVQIAGGQEQPVSILFDGSDKAFRPCKSMSRVIVSAWGPDAKVYMGRSLTLYRDPTVKWGGMEVGGIRISHMSNIDAAMTLALTMTRANKKPFTVKPLVVEKAQDRAEKWSSDLIAAVHKCADAESLNALVENAKTANGIGKLKAGRSDLYDAVLSAIDAARGAFPDVDAFGLLPVADEPERITDDLIDAHENAA